MSILITRKYFNAAKALIDRGARVYENHLVEAIESNAAIAFIDFLLDGISNAISPGMGHRAVSAAVAMSSLEVVRKLVERGLDFNPLDGSEERNPLVQAAKAESIEIVKYLTVRGAMLDLTIQNQTVGCWALYRAACGGHTEIMTFLLDHGIVVDNRTFNRRGSGHTLLCGAASRGHLASMEILLQQGASIDAKCCNHRTALGEAVMNLQPQAVSFLLAQGADLNAQDNYVIPGTTSETLWLTICCALLNTGLILDGYYSTHSDWMPGMPTILRPPAQR